MRYAICLVQGVGALLLANGVSAQVQGTHQADCVNALNRDLQKLALAVAKDAFKCATSFAKGQTDKLGPEGTAQACLGADVAGTVAKAADKTREDFDATCLGFHRGDPTMPKQPLYGATDPTTVNHAARASMLLLVADLFGHDLDAALARSPGEKDTAKCQQAVLKAATKCHDAKLKEFNLCKKVGLKSKRAPFSSVSELEACVAADPQGRVAKACDLVDGHKRDGVRNAIATRCGSPGVDLAQAFPGCGASDADGLHGCALAAASCRSCRALNGGDDLAFPCSGCFDGVIGSHTSSLNDDAFCEGGEMDGERCFDTNPVHQACGPGASCRGTSRAKLWQWSAGPNQQSATLDVPVVGDFRIECDEEAGPDPATGHVPCRCKLLNIEPVDLTPLAKVCFSSSSSECPDGLVDCDGGTPMDAMFIQEHDIGNCGVGEDPNQIATMPGQGNAECETLCQAYCAAQPGDFEVADAACEGYCQAGSRDAMSCTQDVECPDGSCAGGAPVAHAKTCGCSCFGYGGEPSRPGALRCQVAVKITTETDFPCMTEDGIDDRAIILPSICVALTSEEASGEIRQANLDATLPPGVEATIAPTPSVGVPPTCEGLQDGVPAGTTLVGQIGFIDAQSVGDIGVPIQLISR